MNIIDRMKNGERISIGMVHTLPLPGSYRYAGSMDEIIDRAVVDAVALEKAGFDALIIENLNDGPYPSTGSMDTRKIAAFSKVCSRVRDSVSIPIGIDACGDQISGFGIGIVNGVSFIRITSLCDVRVGGKGISFPNPGDVIMTRKLLDAESIKILADIQVKHTYPVFPSISLEESARWAISNCADAIIVTGSETGVAASVSDLERIKRISPIPVIAGSGVDSKNVASQYASCDGCIVGTSLKKSRKVIDPIDLDLASEFMKAVHSAGY